MRRGIGGILLFAILPGLTLGQGRIEQIRRDANRPEPSKIDSKDPPDESPDNCSDGRNSDDEDSPFGNLLGEIGVKVFLSPFTAPRVSLGDDDWSTKALFPDYPYFNNHRGHLYFPDLDNGPDITIRVRPWSIRVAGEEGNDFCGMNRVGIRASLDTSTRFGLQTNWNFLSESLDGGNRDSTVLNDTNLTFRFAQGERAQFHTGIGMRFLFDSDATHTGFNLLYSADFFPRKPWTASAVFDLGNVGSAFILHGRATIGATWQHFDLYAGYDFMRIGSVSIQGPMLGLRFWY